MMTNHSDDRNFAHLFNVLFAFADCILDIALEDDRDNRHNECQHQRDDNGSLYSGLQEYH